MLIEAPARRKMKNQNTHSIAGAFKNARARATRCFSPPLSCKKPIVSEKFRDCHRKILFTLGRRGH